MVGVQGQLTQQTAADVQTRFGHLVAVVDEQKAAVVTINAEYEVKIEIMYRLVCELNLSEQTMVSLKL